MGCGFGCTGSLFGLLQSILQYEISPDARSVDTDTEKDKWGESFLIKIHIGLVR